MNFQYRQMFAFEDPRGWEVNNFFHPEDRDFDCSPLAFEAPSEASAKMLVALLGKITEEQYREALSESQ